MRITIQHKAQKVCTMVAEETLDFGRDASEIRESAEMLDGCSCRDIESFMDNLSAEEDDTEWDDYEGEWYFTGSHPQLYDGAEQDGDGLKEVLDTFEFLRDKFDPSRMKVTADLVFTTSMEAPVSLTDLQQLCQNPEDTSAVKAVFREAGTGLDTSDAEVKNLSWEFGQDVPTSLLDDMVRTPKSLIELAEALLDARK